MENLTSQNSSYRASSYSYVSSTLYLVKCRHTHIHAVKYIKKIELQITLVIFTTSKVTEKCNYELRLKFILHTIYLQNTS